jgi:hypothetical protein
MMKGEVWKMKDEGRMMKVKGERVNAEGWWRRNDGWVGWIGVKKKKLFNKDFSFCPLSLSNWWVIENKLGIEQFKKNLIY